MLDFTVETMIGFSGSRAPSTVSVQALRRALAALPSDAAVVVGCASGIDALVRAACPSARVLRASDYGVGRGALAARSIACVRGDGGGWCVGFVAGCGLSDGASSVAVTLSVFFRLWVGIVGVARVGVGLGCAVLGVLASRCGGSGGLAARGIGQRLVCFGSSDGTIIALSLLLSTIYLQFLFNKCIILL